MFRTDYVDEDPYSKEKLEELKNTLIHSGLGKHNYKTSFFVLKYMLCRNFKG